MMRHFLAPDTIPAIKKSLPEHTRAVLLHEADGILAGNWQLFPGIPVRLSPDVSWNHTLRSPGRWVVCMGRISTIPPWKKEDIKFIWELNRMQFLLPLAQAFALTGRSDYRDQAYAYIHSWIQAHARHTGVNWISPLETALRIISWIWTLELTGFSGKHDDRIVSGIHDQCLFITKNLQNRQYPNNHLIGELAALIICACVFPEFSESPCWLKDGITSMSQQIVRQTYPDGVDREEAWDYHRLVADFCTLVVVHCDTAGVTIPSALRERLEKMYEAMLFCVRPDGMLPNTGDDDAARALRLSSEPGRYCVSALSTGAALFQRPDMKYVAQKIHPETLWLLGEKGRQSFESLQARMPEATSVFLRESGHIVMRSGWQADARYLCFDCAEQGMGQAGHGHADALHFEIHAYGASRIVDAGTYGYNRCPRWRDYFRGTAAHNTVRVDSRDQSEPLLPHDPFGWKQKADARCKSWYTCGLHDFAFAGHDGYARLNIKHERSIAYMKPDAWMISDEITGKGEHVSEFLLHFPAGTKISKETSMSLTALYPDQAIFMIIATNHQGLTLDLIEGCVQPIQGWVSASFGTKTAAPVVSMRRTGKLPHSFETLILCIRTGTAGETS